MNYRKCPYICIRKSDKMRFIPTMIDFENSQAWHQKGQASENGEWIDVSDCEIINNPDYDPVLLEVKTLEQWTTHELKHELEFLYKEVGRQGRPTEHIPFYIMSYENELIKRKIKGITGRRPDNVFLEKNI